MQEALNGALEEGAAGSAQIAVRYRPDGVDLEVLDDGAAGDEQRRLAGARERVACTAASSRRDGGAAAGTPCARGCRGRRGVSRAVAAGCAGSTASSSTASWARCCSSSPRREVASIDPGDAPLLLCLSSPRGYSLPLAFRRTHPLTVAAVCVGSVLAMRLLLTDPTDFFIPFLVAMLVAWAVGAYAEGRAAVVGIVCVVAGILLVSILQDDAVVVGDYIFPPAFGAVVWTAGRAVRMRSRLTEELHEAAVREQEAHERQATPPPPRSAAGSRARCTTSSRTA